MTLPESLVKELEALAAKRSMTLNDYIVEKLWAIVRLNKIHPPDQDD